MLMRRRIYLVAGLLGLIVAGIAGWNTWLTVSAQAPPIKGIVLIERPMKGVFLNEAPDGVSGYQVIFYKGLNSTSTSPFIVQTPDFANTLRQDSEAFIVSRVDLNDVIQPGARDVLLFLWEDIPGWEYAFLKLDDDNGNRIDAGQSYNSLQVP
jgi:hypothetical protein